MRSNEMDESEAQDTKLERIKENLENKNKETDTPEIPCNQGKNKDQENLVAEQDEEDDPFDVTDPGNLDGAARNLIHQRGVELLESGKKTRALQCFLECLAGLSDTTGFTLLPQCLHNIADIYYNKEEYDKAIQFIQAEKMYYETALIDSSILQKKIQGQEKSEEGEEKGVESSEGTKPDAVRADEYENLARMCLDKNQPQLALEYQGKAIKLRQQVFGETHPTTKKSLDFFTVIYAEVGKQQYTESLQKLSEPTTDGSTDAHPHGESGVRPPRPGSGILRKRSVSEEGTSRQNSSENGVRRVHFDESVRDNIEVRRQDEWVSHAVVWVMFGLCLCVLFGLFLYLYCRLDPANLTCSTIRSEVIYYYMRLKFMYYTWNPTPAAMFG